MVMIVSREQFFLIVVRILTCENIATIKEAQFVWQMAEGFMVNKRHGADVFTILAYGYYSVLGAAVKQCANLGYIHTWTKGISF